MKEMKKFFDGIEITEILLGMLTIPISLSFFLMVCILCSKLVVAFYDLIF